HRRGSSFPAASRLWRESAARRRPQNGRETGSSYAPLAKVIMKPRLWRFRQRWQRTWNRHHSYSPVGGAIARGVPALGKETCGDWRETGAKRGEFRLQTATLGTRKR